MTELPAIAELPAMADRVSRARRLLLRAVESLGGTSEGTPDPPGTSADNTNNNNNVFTERNRLFNFGKRAKTNPKPKTKRKKLSMWTHDFVCLSSTTCMKAPSSILAGDLMRAGLGKKSLSVLSFADSSELHDEIMNTFPGLINGGGYELLRVGEQKQRNLLVLIPQPPEGYTVDYLKEVVRQAKVYIRPIQQDLSLEVQSNDIVVSACQYHMKARAH